MEDAYEDDYEDLSILTRPEGRVRQFHRNDSPYHRRLSILTRPEGRVRLMQYDADREYDLLFQSSPAPKDGCDRPVDPCDPLRLDERGASLSILTRPEGRVRLTHEAYR